MNINTNTTAESVIAETRAWVDLAVIGLNLCPFAKAPQIKGLIRYVCCDAIDPQALLDALCGQMHALVDADPAELETTLLIHPHVLGDFVEFNDFLDLAEQAIETLGYEGVLQVASFHPQYQFAGTTADDVANATNRSPYPTLHLLREASVDRAVAAFPEAHGIVEANIATLEVLGADGWAALQERCRVQAEQSVDGI